MSGWGCPHEDKGQCRRVQGKPCDPGMKGCIMSGRFVFSNDDKNTPKVKRELEVKKSIKTVKK